MRTVLIKEMLERGIPFLQITIDVDASFEVSSEELWRALASSSASMGSGNVRLKNDAIDCSRLIFNPLR
jgi:hypothetical protein